MDSTISMPLGWTPNVPASLAPIDDSPSLPRPMESAGIDPACSHQAAEKIFAAPAKPARVQPHLGWALLLTLGLFAGLTVVNMAWGIAAVVVTIAQGKEITATTMFEFGARNASLVLLTLFSVSCLYCLGTTAIAFRGSLKEKLSLRKFTRAQLFAVLMLPLPLAVVISTFAVALMSLLGIDAALGQVVADPPPLVIALLAIAVLPAIGEEVFFRGFLSRGLIARHGMILGVLFATGLFALVHGNFTQIVVMFFMGLVMQLIFLWTRSLLASVLLHGLYNAVIVILNRNAQVELAQVLSAASLPLVLLSLATIAALLTLLFQTRTRWQLPDGTLWSPGHHATEMPPVDLQAIAVNARARALPITVALLGFAALVVMAVLSAA